MRTFKLGVVVLIVALCGCGDDAGNSEADMSLEEFVEAHRTAQRSRDDVKLDKMNLSLMPTRQELRGLMTEDEPGKAFARSYPFVKSAAKKKDVLATLRKNLLVVPPARTEIAAIGATAAEVVAYEKGGNAFKEFPGGMRKFAPLVRDAEQMFYVVEFLEPGKDAGTKFTCFTKINGRWVFIMKPWQRIK